MSIVEEAQAIANESKSSIVVDRDILVFIAKYIVMYGDWHVVAHKVGDGPTIYELIRR